jgi:hypothetical protein
MKSIKNLRQYLVTLPLLADDLVEFHAARLVLLLKLCGTKGRIHGLTKMAKLDFFVRYPQFFSVVCEALGKEVEFLPDTVESSMVRYHYGPWDQRYYHILAYLESRGILEVAREGTAFELTLTSLGEKVATRLEKEIAFAQLVAQMRQVRRILGKKSGSRLKKLVYETFDREVAQLSLGEVIK